LWSNGSINSTITGLTAGLYTVTVTDVKGCSASSSVNILQPSAIVVTATQGAPITCTSSTTTVTVTATGGTGAYTGLGTFTVNAGTYTYNVNDQNGCLGSTTVIVSGPIALPTPVISGTFNKCSTFAGATIFTATPVSDGVNTTQYLWTVPAGMTITNGQGTTSITVTYTATAISNTIAGRLECLAYTNCGSSTGFANISYSATTPVTPGSISGADKACIGDIATYSIFPVFRASSYNWTVPTGATLLSGAGTNIITVQYGAGWNGGDLTVAAVNACGVSLLRTRTVTLNILPASAAINGPVDGICNATNVTYSVTPVIGAVSYNWTLPSGATIVGATNGASINVNFGPAFISGSLSVKAVNACGEGLARSVSLKAAPRMPDVINGPVSVCTGSSQQYSISSIPGASIYIWTVPSGATIDAGQDTKIISMTHSTVASPNGIITVKASNGCGVSAVKVLSVTTNSCIREVESSLNIIAYPNPVKGDVNIQFNAITENESAVIELMDNTGRLLYDERVLTKKGLNEKVLDMHSFSSGIYLLQIRTNDKVEKLKLFVE
jgi:hypothetical protein